jgi:transmembrane sensor
MTELDIDKHLQAARREVRVHAWDEQRVEAAFRELGLRRHGERESRRRVAAVGGLALAAALVALVLFAFRVMSPAAPEAPNAKAAPALERLALGDATEVRFRQGTRLDVKERTDSRVVVTVGQGVAHFKVRHDPRRLFRVEVGDVEVEDLGTLFDVENKGNSVRVSVSEGSVEVSFPEAGGKRGKTTLRAGQSGVYPSAAPHAENVARSPAIDAPAVESSSAAQAVPGPDWRELARAGKHRRAYEIIAQNGFRDVKNDAGDLLLASDVARLSRHPAEAATLLRKLLSGHERDARAPSAAFTLGWVLMNELGRPREAALAFARAEALAPRGNLAEDATARAVEAWYRAGELGRAKAEAERYKKTYPQGRHQATLARLVMSP